MDNTLYTGLSRQTALQHLLDVTANNMANISTAGFKQERLFFETVFKRLDVEGKGVAFVSDASSVTDLSQGPVTRTGNDLDTAIDGNAMYAVRHSSGKTMYTRDGRFSIDQRGNLVLTATGSPVLDNAGSAITLPPGSGNFTIGADGTMSLNGSALAKIGLYSVKAEALRREAEGMFSTGGGVAAAGNLDNSRIRQGYVEGSNVNPVATLTDLIRVQRSYEHTAAMLAQESDRSDGAVKTLGRSKGQGA